MLVYELFSEQLSVEQGVRTPEDFAARLRDVEARLRDAEQWLWDTRLRFAETERRLTETQALACIGSWEWNLQTGEISGTPELRRLLGFTSDGPMPDWETILARFPLSQRHIITEAFNQTLADGEDREIELFLLSSDAAALKPESEVPARYVRATGRRITDEAGTRLVGTLQDVTEERDQQQRLREAARQEDERRRFLLRATSASPDLMYIMDTRDQKMTWANRLPLSILGYSQEESAKLQGHAWVLLHPDDVSRRADFELRRNSLTDDGCIEFEHRMRHNNGTWRWLLARETVFTRDADGTILSTVGVMEDITQRREAELARAASEHALQEAIDALRASEERYALALDGARDAVWDANLETGDTYFSPRWKEIAGYDTAESQNELETERESYLSRVHPDDRARVEDELRQSIEIEADTFRWEYRMRRRDGLFVWVISRGKVLRRADNTPYRIVGTTTDISERKAAEDALRFSEARFRSLALASALGVWHGDGVGEANSNTSAWLEFTGQTAEEMEGAGWLNGVHPDDRAKVQGDWAKVLEKAQRGEEVVSDLTYRVRRHDGVYRHLRSRGVPVRNSDGVLREWIGAFHDVTEQITAREETGRRAERNRQIARTLEQSLIPTVSSNRIPGHEVRVFSVPRGEHTADEDEVIGGDFYDVFPLPGDRWAIVVGDVMGKGLTAALSIAEVRFALRGFLHEGGSPGAALARLNRFLLQARRLEEQPRNVLVALALVVLDNTAQTVTASVAGAEAPLLLSPSHPVRILDHGGLILGTDDSEYPDTTVPIFPGDVLALTTDGLTEARGAGELFGVENVVRFLAESLVTPGATLEQAGHKTLAAARNWADDDFSDDVCLLLLRY